MVPALPARSIDLKQHAPLLRATVAAVRPRAVLHRPYPEAVAQLGFFERPVGLCNH
jgi:hypothetical protein